MTYRSALWAFAGAVAVSCLLVSAASAAPARLLADTGFLEGPGKTYNVMSDIDAGDKVDVIWCGTTEDWCLVSYHNRKGWVPLALLKLGAGGLGDADGIVTKGGDSGGTGAAGSGNTASTDSGNSNTATGRGRASQGGGTGKDTSGIAILAPAP